MREPESKAREPCRETEGRQQSEKRRTEDTIDAQLRRSMQTQAHAQVQAQTRFGSSESVMERMHSARLYMYKRSLKFEVQCSKEM